MNWNWLDCRRETCFRRAWRTGVLLTLLLGASAYAGTISGTVVQPPGEASVSMPVGILVRASALKGRPYVLQAQVDASGHFSLGELPPGTYKLELLVPGRPTLTRTLQVTVAAQTLRLEQASQTLRLEPAGTGSQAGWAGEIVIREKAEARQTPAAFSDLSRSDLEARAAVRDLPLLLSELPSSHFYSENGNGLGYNYLTLRGFDQRRISVMIDGVPQNDPEDHSVYWINFADQTANLEAVQVQRGAGAGFYGPPAIGGAINLLSRPAERDPRLQLDVGYGSFGTQRFSGSFASGLLGDRWAVSGRLSHIRSEGYRDWSWSRTTRAYLNLGYFGPGTSLRLQLFGGPQQDALAYTGIPKSYNEDDDLRRCNTGAPDSDPSSLAAPECSNPASGDREHFGQYHAYLTWDQQLSHRLGLKNTLFFIYGGGYFDFSGAWADPYYLRFDPETEPEYFLDSEAPGYVAIPADTLLRAFVDNRQVGWLPRLAMRHWVAGTRSAELTAGLELRLHRSLHWGRIQEGSFGQAQQDTYVGDDADRHHYEYRGGKDIAGLFFNERLALGALSLEANLQAIHQRYLLYDELYLGQELVKPYSFLNPRLGGNYNLTSSLNVFASVAQTRREPRLKELYDAENAAYGYAPDPDRVRPEFLSDFETGLHLERERARATLNAYFMDFRDEIVKTGGLDQYGQPYFGNAEHTRHLGVELEAAGELLPWLRAAGSASLSRNRFVRFDEYLDSGELVSRDGNPLSGSPDLLANARLTMVQPDWRLSLDGRYVGLQYTDNSADTDDAGNPANGTGVVDPSFLLGAQLEVRLNRRSRLAGLSFSLDAQNLTGQRVLLMGLEKDNFFPAAPLTLYLQARYVWGQDFGPSPTRKHTPERIEAATPPVQEEGDHDVG